MKSRRSHSRGEKLHCAAPPIRVLRTGTLSSTVNPCSAACTTTWLEKISIHYFLMLISE